MTELTKHFITKRFTQICESELNEKISDNSKLEGLFFLCMLIILSKLSQINKREYKFASTVGENRVEDAVVNERKRNKKRESEGERKWS